MAAARAVVGAVVTRKSGLGRGLDALLPSSGRGDDLERRGSLLEVPLDAISANPNQPRQTFDPAGIEELAASVTELGILQPLLVRDTGGGSYELIAGERRLRAAHAAGLDVVPVIVVETDERGSLERAIVENIHRADLNPIEEAAAYRQLIADAGLTQEQLGERLGRNRVTITNSLRLLDLPTAVQRLLVEGRLTAGHGRALLRLSGNPFQERMARRAAEEKLSVRETEDEVARYVTMTEGMAPRARSREAAEESAAVAEARRRLSERLQTRVKVQMGKRKGKITVEFVSPDDLDRLVRAIAGDDAGPPRRDRRTDQTGAREL
ncbi:MAG: ParB/RepB/Spo0J family partition protein [Actinomycetota bacterium]|nr:ParB/RepB/Spo0J family partition protein [Actinomycetota bacterium]